MAPIRVTADYYAILEVPRDATSEVINSNYRRLAMARHPDKNPGNPDATASFQLLRTAFETLGDPETRERYDARWSYLQSYLRNSQRVHPDTEKCRSAAAAAEAEKEAEMHQARKRAQEEENARHERQKRREQQIWEEQQQRQEQRRQEQQELQERQERQRQQQLQELKEQQERERKREQDERQALQQETAWLDFHSTAYDKIIAGFNQTLKGYAEDLKAVQDEDDRALKQAAEEDGIFSSIIWSMYGKPPEQEQVGLVRENARLQRVARRRIIQDKVDQEEAKLQELESLKYGMEKRSLKLKLEESQVRMENLQEELRMKQTRRKAEEDLAEKAAKRPRRHTYGGS